MRTRRAPSGRTLLALGVSDAAIAFARQARWGLVNSSKTPKQDFAGGDDRGMAVLDVRPDSDLQALMEAAPGEEPTESRPQFQQRHELLAAQVWPIVERVASTKWEQAIVMAICQGIPFRKIEAHMVALRDSGQIEADAPVAKSAIHRHWNALKERLAEEMQYLIQ